MSVYTCEECVFVSVFDYVYVCVSVCVCVSVYRSLGRGIFGRRERGVSSSAARWWRAFEGSWVSHSKGRRMSKGLGWQRQTQAFFQSQ